MKFKCDSCELSFKSEHELNCHDQKDHTSNYDCDQCDHQVTSEALLSKHIQLKHIIQSNECKGVGSQKCGKNFQSYNDLMDHRRDEHNLGNKVCRYFKNGTCYFMDSDKGDCWYLHKIVETNSNEAKNGFECKSCDKTFKTRSEVMNHRKEQHEDEVPLCNEIKEGKRCTRHRCWFSHKNPESSQQVNPPVNVLDTNIRKNSEDFWKPLPSSRPPDQMDHMMAMLTTVMKEVSQLKEQLLQTTHKLINKISNLKNIRKYGKSNNITVVRSNNVIEAFSLPTVINLNPRSVYNKIDEFHALVQEEDVDIVVMSESWERENKTLQEIIKLDDHTVISNVHQRKEVGGRPALIINNKKFLVQDLTQSVIKVPWGVEVVWALITPKNVQNESIVQKIVVGALYSKPNSRKKTARIDHITDVYNQLGVKKKKIILYWIIGGDANELKLDMILQLSHNMKQMLTDFTRLNPPRILDLGKFYQKPLILDPLDNDPNKNGSPSDHKIIKLSPISNINNKPARS